jgi:hypothetical protein
MALLDRRRLERRREPPFSGLAAADDDAGLVPSPVADTVRLTLRGALRLRSDDKSLRLLLDADIALLEGDDAPPLLSDSLGDRALSELGRRSRLGERSSLDLFFLSLFSFISFLYFSFFSSLLSFPVRSFSPPALALSRSVLDLDRGVVAGEVDVDVVAAGVASRVESEVDEGDSDSAGMPALLRSITVLRLVEGAVRGVLERVRFPSTSLLALGVEGGLSRADVGDIAAAAAAAVAVAVSGRGALDPLGGLPSFSLVPAFREADDEEEDDISSSYVCAWVPRGGGKGVPQVRSTSLSLRVDVSPSPFFPSRPPGVLVVGVAPSRANSSFGMAALPSKRHQPISRHARCSFFGLISFAVTSSPAVGGAPVAPLLLHAEGDTSLELLLLWVGGWRREHDAQDIAHTRRTQ